MGLVSDSPDHPPDNPLRTGEFVNIRREGSTDEWCAGWVAVASKRTDPQAVMLRLGGAVRTENDGLILDGLAIFVNYENQTVRSIFGDLYEIERSGGEDES